MLRRRLFICITILVGLLGCTRPDFVAIPEGTTLIMLRHGDRDTVELNAKGRARAQALVAALDGIEIDAIYAPRIQRNLDTAAPLAAARGLEVQLTDRFAAAEEFLDIVSQTKGETIVWVGNKDNLSPIWEFLGLDRPAPLAYGDLFIVRSATPSLPNVTRLRFGPD